MIIKLYHASSSSSLAEAYCGRPMLAETQERTCSAIWAGRLMLYVGAICSQYLIGTLYAVHFFIVFFWSRIHGQARAYFTLRIMFYRVGMPVMKRQVDPFRFPLH